MASKLDRILMNQRAIMKSLAFGFSALRQCVLTAIEETEKVLGSTALTGSTEEKKQ